MIKTQGLTHLQLTVSDVKRSLKFYQTLFGMEIQYWAGADMVFLRTPGSRDTITLHEWKANPSQAEALLTLAFGATGLKA